MKEALKIDQNGYLIDTTLVDDNVSGVFPLYRKAELPDQSMESEAENRQPALELIGYTVAIPVPEGLYKPRFDFAAWELYNKPPEPEVGADGMPKMDESGNVIYKPRPVVKLWVEGLIPEEIEAIKNPPKQPTAEERIAALTAQLKMQEKQMAAVSADLQAVMEYIMNKGE